MDWRIQLILTLLERDICRTPPCRELAEKANLSYSRLSHLFKAQTGCSLSKYIRRVRMRKAAVLLESTFLSVKQTMVAVGINDLSHFVRDFKRASGHTPTEYRKLHLEKSRINQSLTVPIAKSAN